MTEEAEGLPSSSPTGTVKEIPQEIPRQSLRQKIVSLFKGIGDDIGSGRAHEILSPTSGTKKQVFDNQLRQKKLTEPGES
ncbi:hypothetical protein A2165_01845 [Candidatus Curtissbacteria bacterium RBG_13_40_7]|uniref:Uncharacterized protein n=1 Tax=Candidatus Curtissbacteria bacterium RBG_13_40_7 TaxID=1797706 RepID=A0A1F5FWP5_9BACT|nr:MAG: hypothetical protein A2165_01845 [Candidatus Curtissbacteria bacterium RBG_13_40_7]